ncbi:MAG TPA: peptidylprolyl isomerase [Sphingomonas sp.]|nr:peptidylprolyl isomerase [Sphingomonas sp.]HEU0043990.1 peptidylprolyl isomerase [Sphingomonas sp.]
MILSVLAGALARVAMPLAVQAMPVPPAPSEIVAAAPSAEWVAIAPEDLLVMELAPTTTGARRRVLIQLIPAPFSQSWLANVRTLARARWWDGLSVNRVQDNYVAQWGDADAEDKAKARALPAGLTRVPEREYAASEPVGFSRPGLPLTYQGRAGASSPTVFDGQLVFRDIEPWNYAAFKNGWAFAGSMNPHQSQVWPIHCYAMVGVGRGLSPDTGSGAELYAVIGHAPRHLDRNIALVGRVVDGIEHLSSLPRGTEALGFYKTPAERTAIRSVRLASDLPAASRPRLQYLSTESASFAAYANARANRRDPFFIRPAGGTDICNVPVPIRRAP